MRAILTVILIVIGLFSLDIYQNGITLDTLYNIWFGAMAIFIVLLASVLEIIKLKD